MAPSQSRSLAGTSSCRYIIVQVYHRAGISSCRYIIVQVHHRAGISSCRYIIVHVYHRAGISSCRYIIVQVHHRAGISSARYRDSTGVSTLPVPHLGNFSTRPSELNISSLCPLHRSETMRFQIYTTEQFTQSLQHEKFPMTGKQVW